MKPRFMGMTPKEGANVDNWKTTNYPTLGSFLKFLEKNENTPTSQKDSHMSGSDFSGTANFKDALQLLKDGSPEIMKGLKSAVKLAVDKLAKELNTLPQGYVNDVCGLFFDVAKVIDGEPECWLREPWDKERKPRISVPVVGSYNANVTKETVIKNASEVIALVKALEDNGFETELNMIFAIEDFDSKDGSNYFCSVRVKGFDESFNWSKVSAMIHPAFFRRLMFRDMELAAPTSLAWGYGRTTSKTLSPFEGGESAIKLEEKASIERFKKQVLYRLGGNKK